MTNERSLVGGRSAANGCRHKVGIVHPRNRIPKQLHITTKLLTHGCTWHAAPYLSGMTFKVNRSNTSEVTPNFFLASFAFGPENEMAGTSSLAPMNPIVVQQGGRVN